MTPRQPARKFLAFDSLVSGQPVEPLIALIPEESESMIWG